MVNPIIFKRNSDIGSADAETDVIFLDNCFVDTGDLTTLLDCNNPRCLILGRTGSGKTALVKQVLKNPRTIELSPETLALNYVTNSNTIKFFEEAGVHLDVFYQLLWRHIISVELLKLKYSINNEDRQNRFLQTIGGLLDRNQTKKKALAYLQDWGSHFWEETEYRTKEFVRRLEINLQGNAKIDAKYLTLGAEGARKLTEEEKIEVVEHGTKVVNDVQIKELHEVVRLLSEDIFTDPQNPHYVVIDRLDEDWVDDRIRFKLIKALIETVRTFKRIQFAKIIVALRTDLHFRVLQGTPQSGFQEEKYRSYYLNLRWSREQLIQMLNDRVGFMFRRQYTRAHVGLADIIATNQLDQKELPDYILERTFFRPREAIIYLNGCIEQAEGKSRITPQIVKSAETVYSQQRLTSLADEWRRDYPNLLPAAQGLLSRRLNPFSPRDITEEECEILCLKVLEQQVVPDDPLKRFCEDYYIHHKLKPAMLCQVILSIFYQTGLIGIKSEPQSARHWSFYDDPVIDPGRIHPDCIIDIHKTFWVALGITTRERRISAKA